MGLLLDTNHGRLVALPAHAVIGRSPLCSIQIAEPCASAEHAAISWTEAGWELRDLGSSNGTWVDDQRVRAGERVALQRDARLGFGTPEATWLLADARPAGPTARHARTTELAHAASSLLALPSERDPRATIYQRADGGWAIEQAGAVGEVRDGDTVEVDGAAWTLFLPARLGPVPPTVPEVEPLVLSALELVFAPSRDEEHVELRVRTRAGREIELPVRASHYTLLTLARARQRDEATGVPAAECGWIYANELADMLGYTAERLNVEIFRARAMLGKIGIVDSMHIVERRVPTRQLRLGVAGVRIQRAR